VVDGVEEGLARLLPVRLGPHRRARPQRRHLLRRFLECTCLSVN
jgi:hypothetical protein